MAECQESCHLGFRKPSISWRLEDRGGACRRGSLLKPGVSCLLFLAGRLFGSRGEFPVVVVHFWPRTLVHPSLPCCSHHPLLFSLSPPLFPTSPFFLVYKDWMFVFPPKFLWWGPNSQVLAFGGRWGRRGWSLRVIWFAWGHGVEPPGWPWHPKGWRGQSSPLAS